MKKGFKAFLIYLFVPLLFSMIFYNFTNKNILLSNVLFYLVLLLFFLFCSWKDLVENFKDFKLNYKKYLKIIFKYTLICFVLMMLSNFLIQLMVSNLPSNELNNRKFIEENIFLSLSYLLIIAPMLEEYVFRYSFREIKNKYIFIIITSLLFSILHLLSITTLSELLYVIPYFIIGFGFSNCYIKTKNYFSSLIGHIIHNLLCVIIILVF